MFKKTNPTVDSLASASAGIFEQFTSTIKACDEINARVLCLMTFITKTPSLLPRLRLS